MKKLVLVFVLLFSFLIGCTPQPNIVNSSKDDCSCINTNSSAEKTVKSALNALKKSDIKKFNEYINYHNYEIKSETLFKDSILFSDNIDDEDKIFISSFVSDLSYKVTETQEKGSNASVKVKITNKDLSDLWRQLISKDTDILDGDSTNKLFKLINQTNKTKTFDVTLTLEKISEEWKINMNTEFANAITGGMFNILENFF